MITRRGLITGLVSLVAAPAIVRVGSLMPVKQMIESPLWSADTITWQASGDVGPCWMMVVYDQDTCRILETHSGGGIPSLVSLTLP